MGIARAARVLPVRGARGRRRDYVPLPPDPAADGELPRSARRHCKGGRAAAFPAFRSAAIQSAAHPGAARRGVPDGAIVALYDALVALQPTIGARVSRACAVGAADGAEAGLAALAALAAADVRGYQPYWAALAHLAAAAGDAETARVARERAVGLSTDPAVRRFLAQGA